MRTWFEYVIPMKVVQEVGPRYVEQLHQWYKDHPEVLEYTPLSELLGDDMNHVPIPTEPVTVTITEWRVTGKPGKHHGVTFPDYDFTWREDRMTRDRQESGLSAEASARNFVEGIKRHERYPWAEGPHLSKRFVTYTEWEPVND